MKTLLISSLILATFQPRTVGETWTVFQAQPSGNCVMQAADQVGTTFTFIRYPNHTTSVIFSNDNWKSLSTKDERDLRLGLNTSPYSYRKVSVRNGYIAVNFQPSVLEDLFRNQRVLALNHRGNTLTFLYTGPVELAALREVDRCAGYSNDPFAS